MNLIGAIMDPGFATELCKRKPNNIRLDIEVFQGLKSREVNSLKRVLKVVV